MKISKGGYTLIELIMTIVIMGILVAVISQAYSGIIRATFQNSDIEKEINLARVESSVCQSISYTDVTLANGYDNTNSNYLNSGYSLRRQVLYLEGNDATSQSLKKITISVTRPDGLIGLTSVTYRAKNVNW